MPPAWLEESLHGQFWDASRKFEQILETYDEVTGGR